MPARRRLGAPLREWKGVRPATEARADALETDAGDLPRRRLSIGIVNQTLQPIPALRAGLPGDARRKRLYGLTQLVISVSAGRYLLA